MTRLRSVFLTSENPEAAACFYEQVAQLPMEKVGVEGEYVYWRLDRDGMQLARAAKLEPDPPLLQHRRSGPLSCAFGKPGTRAIRRGPGCRHRGRSRWSKGVVWNRLRIGSRAPAIDAERQDAGAILARRPRSAECARRRATQNKTANLLWN